MKKLNFKAKSEPTKDEQIKKLKGLNLRLQIELIIVFAALLGLFFYNYNYTVFKVLMTGFYTDTQAVEDICLEASGSDSMDNTVIALFMDKLHQTNGDSYTMLFKRGELKAEHQEMEEESRKSAVYALNDKVGCITLTAFSANTQRLLKEDIEKISSRDNLIIDLRDNPGGVLKYADKAAEYFLPKGSVIADYNNYRLPILSSRPVSKNSSPLEFKHIYILQNEYTASAAEVFINALKENLDNVTVVGSPSYGKGVGQAEMKLLNGFGIKATTLDILTPKGNSINHKGITPDVTPQEDEMEYALKVIKSS